MTIVVSENLLHIDATVVVGIQPITPVIVQGSNQGNPVDVISAAPIDRGISIIGAELVGPAGPQGIPGDSSESLSAARVDIVSSSLIYKGFAEPGSVETDSVWAIVKIVIADGSVEKTWAGGSNDRNQIWDNRYSLAYS